MGNELLKAVHPLNQKAAISTSPRSQTAVYLLTPIILYVTCSIIGIGWGLPSRSIDKYLFGDSPAWSGQKIYRLANASDKFDGDIGADVDPDPLNKASTYPILLTATDEKIAKILLRYRLYTYQPDEMISMMALAGMKPGDFDFDPKLYQYGGLFIYPVGTLIKLCGLVGLIDVRGDVTFYLDHPDEFAKFYIVSRAYAAAWGLLGVIVVFLITRRLANTAAATVSAILFALMPVVVCMAHEGKPHLPGAVLMLSAVMFGMRQLAARHDSTLNWWLMCISCGAAFGMVLSSGPIFVLIPLVAWMMAAKSQRSVSRAIGQTAMGVSVGIATYIVCNPYILINALTNQDVLRSNFGNSLAMYNIARIGEGFIRVLELTAQGATSPILLLGIIAAFAAASKKRRDVLPLLVPAAVFFLQFVLIGAGKPAEYGRFGIFTDTALAIGAACMLTSVGKVGEKGRYLAATVVIMWTAMHGAAYLWNFHLDSIGQGSRQQLASAIDKSRSGRSSIDLATTAEPGPYCFPPINFSKTNLWLVENHRVLSFAKNVPSQTIGLIGTADNWTEVSVDALEIDEALPHAVFNETSWSPQDWLTKIDTPISWANKPFYWLTKNSGLGPIEIKLPSAASTNQ